MDQSKKREKKPSSGTWEWRRSGKKKRGKIRTIGEKLTSIGKKDFANKQRTMDSREDSRDVTGSPPRRKRKIRECIKRVYCK